MKTLSKTLPQKLSVVLAATLGWSMTAHAVPTLYPQNAGRFAGIQNVTNSNLVADNTDPGVMWVMPPMSAIATVGDFHTPEMSLGFCKGLATTIESYNENLLTEKELNAKFKPASTKLAAMEDKLSALRLDAANYAASANIQRYDDLTQRIKDLTEHMKYLEEKMRDCSDDCGALDKDFEESLAEKRVLEKEQNEFGKLYAKDVRIYNQKQEKVKAQEENIQRHLDQFKKIRRLIADANTSAMASFRELGSLVGGRAAMDYDSGWEENIDTLRRHNPGWTFKPVDTWNTKIRSNLTSVKGGMPATAIYAYEFGGETLDGVLDIGSYQPRLSGNIVLSLSGACPIVYPDMFEIRDHAGTQKMRYGLLVTYDYPSVFNTNVKFRYNLYHMYERIQRSGSKGGFFSSKSFSELFENQIDRDTFSVDWKETDPNNTMTFEQRQEIVEQVKAHLILRIATMTNPLAMSQVVSSGTLPPPPHGAVVIADGISKTCPHVYCQAAAVAFRALDAIFGSSSSTSTYRRTMDKTVEEQWSYETTRKVPWTTFYTAQ